MGTGFRNQIVRKRRPPNAKRDRTEVRSRNSLLPARGGDDCAPADAGVSRHAAPLRAS